MAHIDGIVESVERADDGGWQIRIVNSEEESSEYPLPAGALRLVQPGEAVNEGTVLAVTLDANAPAAGSEGDTEAAGGLALAGARVVDAIHAGNVGEVEIGADSISVVWREYESRVYDVPAQQDPLVEPGQEVMAGQELSTGQLPLPEVLDIRGQDGLHRYFIEEVQEVYRSQGVSIHDKHIEVILRQMLRRVEIVQAGDTEFIAGDVVDKFRFQEQNERALAAGGEPATAKTMLLGVSKASLNTDSFLSKASFQETTRVLTMAAVASDRDRLRGLKENVIIGRLIPARLQSLLDAEKALAMRDGLDDYDDDFMTPDWLSGEREVFAGLGVPAAEVGEDVIDSGIISGELPSGAALAAFGGSAGDGGEGFGAPGFQVRTAEEEDELLRRAQSLTESESEVDMEVAATASRIFSPFEDDEEDDIPAL